MPKKSSLPKRIYVKREVDENDKDSTWLTANETIRSMDDGDRVGVYELKEMRTMRIDQRLV